MLTWPHADSDWAAQLTEVLPTFAQIATAISRDEPVLNVCRDAQHQAEVADLLSSNGTHSHHLGFALADSDDTWARDHGPITTLTVEGPCLNDFVFDGWGGKFAASRDNRINRELARQGIFAGAPMLSHPLVLEGGALETDGQGTLLATRSSVLDRARNPDLSSADIEQSLRDTLGFRRFLWLDHGQLSGDDTDAHIDILARFTDPHTIVYAAAPGNDSDNAELAAMYRQLRGFRDIDGNPYHLRELPFPGVQRDASGRRLPAGYANFLITNQSVLLPVYDVAADASALQLLQDCFPDRRVVPIDCRAIIEQNGSLHCLTMHFPVGVSLTNAADTTA